MNFVLTETNLTNASCHTLYRASEYIIRADRAEEVPGVLRELDRALENGQYCAGYLSYELGYLFEPRLEALMQVERALPLLWFGVFDEA